MSKIRRIFSGGEDGFTLIELLVVIAVLGILAAIAIPRMSGITDEAEKAAVEADMRNIQTGMEMIYASTGEYPDSASEATTSLAAYIDLDNLGDYTSGAAVNTTFSATSYSITYDEYGVSISSD